MWYNDGIIYLNRPFGDDIATTEIGSGAKDFYFYNIDATATTEKVPEVTEKWLSFDQSQEKLYACSADNKNGFCSGTFVCQNGVCEYKEIIDCETHEECSDDSPICSYGKCIYHYCSTENECPPGSECLEDHCKVLELMDQCVVDGQCPGGTCELSAEKGYHICMNVPEPPAGGSGGSGGADPDDGDEGDDDGGDEEPKCTAASCVNGVWFNDLEQCIPMLTGLIHGDPVKDQNDNYKVLLSWDALNPESFCPLPGPGVQYYIEGGVSEITSETQIEKNINQPQSIFTVYPYASGNVNDYKEEVKATITVLLPDEGDGGEGPGGGGPEQDFCQSDPHPCEGTEYCSSTAKNCFAKIANLTFDIPDETNNPTLYSFTWDAYPGANKYSYLITIPNEGDISDDTPNHTLIKDISTTWGDTETEKICGITVTPQGIAGLEPGEETQLAATIPFTLTKPEEEPPPSPGGSGGPPQCNCSKDTHICDEGHCYPKITGLKIISKDKEPAFNEAANSYVYILDFVWDQAYDSNKEPFGLYILTLDISGQTPITIPVKESTAKELGIYVPANSDTLPLTASVHLRESKKTEVSIKGEVINKYSCLHGGINCPIGQKCVKSDAPGSPPPQCVE